MHLHELLGWQGPMTHRQFLTWDAWLELQWNKPTRSDYYTLRVAETMAGKVLEPIKFGESRKLTKEEHAQAAKERALARSGGKVIRKTITRQQLDGNDSGGS